MRLSLSGFLFEDEYRSQSLTFSALCALARSAGYDGVELRRTQVTPQTSVGKRREIRTVVEDQGLYVTCLTARGVPDTGMARDEFFLGYLELCRDLGSGLLKIGGEAEWLRWAAERALEYDVALASNNHVGGILETVAGTRDHLDTVAHPDYGLLYDALHLRIAGEDYMGCIPEFCRVTRNVLVHSMRSVRPGETADIERGGRAWIKALPDEAGVQDWPGILGAFRELGYDGLITVIESGWPVDERVLVARRCAEVLRSLWRRGDAERRNL